jgi:serine phosphatase RsbU (regulator of sigma subunit)
MKRWRAILALIFIIAFLPLFSQLPREKELLDKINSSQNDSLRFYAIRRYCKMNHLSPDSNLKYSRIGMNTAVKTGSKYILVRAYELLGDAYWYAHSYSRASEYYFKELELAEMLQWKEMLGRSYYNIGWMKCVQRRYFKDRHYLLRALKIFEEERDTLSILEVYNGLAGVYNIESARDPKMLDSANYYFRNLVFYSERRGRYDVTIHFNYANFLTRQKRYSEAIAYLNRCIIVALKKNDSAYYASCELSLAAIMLQKDSNEKALKLFNEALPILSKNRSFDGLSDAYHGLADIYYQRGRYKESADYYKLFQQYTDSMYIDQVEAYFLESETAYEIEKRETNIRQLEQQNEISAIKNRQNKYIIFGLLFIGGLVIFIAINLFRSNKAKQEANRTLNEKNQMIEEQKKKVEERNLDITNSINYARRIQEAILPPKELKYKLFRDAFVLFQPKDIVSGDFYWFAEKNGRRIIAAIDCTGHGVPGAFMSMIGNTFLNEAIYEKGLTKPSFILDDLRDHVISSLKQTDVIDSTKDGMDMALLSFNDEKNTVEFAGANNPLWLIRNGECIEYKADKRPIGYYRGLGLPFTNTEIELKKGDALYIFTDGFADQFGGDDGKKFKYRPLRDLLISIQHMDMLKQEEFLIRKFSEWKGSLEQVDDVCIIGIRI